MEDYDCVAFITCWHCLEFLIMNEKISKCFLKNTVILHHVFFIHDMIFYFNIFVLQEFQMLALSLLTAVAVIVKSFCEKKDCAYSLEES